MTKNPENDPRQMMLKIMRENIKDHEEKIDYIRKIFNISEEKEKDLVESAEKQLIHGNFSWNGVLKITVVEGRSLKVADLVSGTSDPFCSVKIGQIEQRTEKCQATLNPKWNFSMEFDVRSMREKDVSTFENFSYSLFSMLFNKKNHG